MSRCNHDIDSFSDTYYDHNECNVTRTETGPSFYQHFTLINSIIQSLSMAPTNDYGEEIEKSEGKRLKNREENSTLQSKCFFLRSTSINSIILPPTIQYCEEKQRKRQKSYKLLIFHSCCLTHSHSHSPMTLWHFSSKNSKDSFHVVYPKFSKSKTIK